jgi:hypothetical protein
LTSPTPYGIYVKAMSRVLRLKHQHQRSPQEVEALARFVVSRVKGHLPPLAVLCTQGGRDYPRGLAWLGEWPHWALELYPRKSRLRDAMYAIMVNIVTDRAPCLGHPRVCWHSTKICKAFLSNPDSPEYQPGIANLYYQGETKYGRWPIFITHDWREAFVHTFAHEVCHVLQAERGTRYSEVECEAFAHSVLVQYRWDYDKKMYL